MTNEHFSITKVLIFENMFTLNFLLKIYFTMDFCSYFKHFIFHPIEGRKHTSAQYIFCILSYFLLTVPFLCQSVDWKRIRRGNPSLTGLYEQISSLLLIMQMRPFRLCFVCNWKSNL